jgi:hypothetical protein
MTQILMISFAQFIQSLIAIGYFVAGILMLMILWNIIGWIYENIIKGFLAPLHGHRSYFYNYHGAKSTFYSERFLKILFFIKLGRNKRWAIHNSLVGFVKKPFWLSSKYSKTLNIFTRAHGHSEPVAFATFKHDGSNVKLANIHMMKFKSDGKSTPDNDNPVGYVDENGNIYKYYKDYNSYKKKRRLKDAEKLGSCAYLLNKEKENFTTSGEAGDADVLKYITIEDYSLAEQLNEEGQTTNLLRDSWFALRLNKRKKQQVKAAAFDATNNTSRKRCLYLFIWRFINVITLSWNVKSKAFGYGYSKENLNYGKSTNLETDTYKTDDNQKGIPLNYIGCAALLLLEEEGFLRYEDGIEKDENLGWVETALISLVVYLGLYKAITQIGFISTVFPFVGPEISTVLIMVLLFIGIWWMIHLIYNYILDRPYYLRQFLKMLNANVGTLAFVYPLIFISIVGFVLTIFVLPHILSAFFISILIAVFFNITRIPHVAWDIVDPFEDDSDTYTHSDDNDYSESEEELVEREFSWTINNSFKNFSAKMSLPFFSSQIAELRKLNPFYSQSVYKYSETAGKMTESEINSELDEEFGATIVPDLDSIKDKFNRISAQHKLSKLEKMSMILGFVQQTIKYAKDTDSEALIKEGINKEYCRYSRETLFDKEGDCDCKSQLTATLLASFGYTVGYFTNETHAFIGIASSELENQSEHFQNMFFSVPGSDKKFLYCETTASGWSIGVIPPDFFPLKLEDHYIINE